MLRLLTISVAALCCLAASAAAAEAPALTWQQQDTSVALVNHGKVVWRAVFDRKTGKPTMDLGLLDGTRLTRPWPFPANYPKNDHVWHKGLWWSWKAINGINFWEEHQEGSDPTDVAVTRRDDGSARIEMTVSYHLPDSPPLVVEKRLVEVAAPDAAGSYLITWRAEFAAGGKDPVTLNRNGYGGLAIRFAGEFVGDPAKDPNAWTFVKSDEQAQAGGDGSGKKPAGNRWIAYVGTAQNGEPACVAMFDHPDNLRHPTQWAVRNQYPYLNPCFIAAKEDYILQPGKPLTLKYGILIHAGKASPADIEQAWRSFAGKARPENAAEKDRANT